MEPQSIFSSLSASFPSHFVAVGMRRVFVAGLPSHCMDLSKLVHHLLLMDPWVISNWGLL